jgi:hypothetical protein
MSRTPEPATNVRTLVEARALLDTWSAMDWSDGLQLDTLPPLRSLVVQTRNTDYRVTVIDGRRGEVLVTGGRFFPNPTRARLNGSTMGGSLLKWRGVYCGFRLELQLGTQTIITTRVRAIAMATADTVPGESVH